MSWLHQLLLYHIMCNLHVGERCALAVTSLKHEKLLLFNSEFKVLHVTKFLFKTFANFYKLLVGVFEDRVLCHGCHRKRCTNTSNDILTLCIYKVFTVERIFTCCWITSEGYAGRAVITHISKHHSLDIDRSTPLVRNFVLPTVKNRSFIHPASKYGANRTD